MSDELEVRKLNRTESWELTDEIRQGYETIHESRVAQAERLARAYAGYAWEGMGYDSFDEFHAEEFGDELKHQRLELEERISSVKVLADSGMAKTKIAEILGIGRATVYRDLAETSSSVSPDTSSEVDAAGQSVALVRQIDEDQYDTHPTPHVTTKLVNLSDTQIERDETGQLYRVGPDPSNMILNIPSHVTIKQIIETDTSEDTPDYFTPRHSAPSWSPPQVQALPPVKVEAYDDPQDDTPEFLEPALKLQKVGQANKEPSDKHCKTCACNLLP